MSQLSLTCVLPTYNNATFLPPTVKSLLKQDYENYTIIIIDDCSSDSTSKLLDFYEKNNKIEIIRLDKRLGAAACRNIANIRCESDLIAVCDSGDIYHKERLKDAVCFFENNKDMDIYWTACVEINAFGEQIDVHLPQPFEPDKKNSLFHPTVVYKTKVPKQIKYREGNLFTDQYETFFYDAYNAGFKFNFTNECFTKKMKQNKDLHAYEQRIKQRMANYKEYGIEVSYA